MTSRKPILCLDFDGVIHSYISGWQGAATIPDPPVPDAIPFLLTALDEFSVAIFSSRSRNLPGRWAMQRWLGRAIADHWQNGGHEPSLAECECWGDAAGVWRRFSWPWFKPAAFVTIDDRAITFDGTWPDLGYLKRFQPWNKRQPIKPQCQAVRDDNGDWLCEMCEVRFPSERGYECFYKPLGSYPARYYGLAVSTSDNPSGGHTHG